MGGGGMCTCAIWGRGKYGTLAPLGDEASTWVVVACVLALLGDEASLPAPGDEAARDFSCHLYLLASVET